MITLHLNNSHKIETQNCVVLSEEQRGQIFWSHIIRKFNFLLSTQFLSFWFSYLLRFFFLFLLLLRFFYKKDTSARNIIFQRMVHVYNCQNIQQTCCSLSCIQSFIIRCIFTNHSSFRTASTAFSFLRQSFLLLVSSFP